MIGWSEDGVFGDLLETSSGRDSAFEKIDKMRASDSYV